MKLKDHCNNCGSDNVMWHQALTVPNGIQQNRLNTHDIVPIFYLGCEDCSETIQTISEGSFMRIVNALILPRAKQ